MRSLLLLLIGIVFVAATVWLLVRRFDEPVRPGAVGPALPLAELRTDDPDAKPSETAAASVRQQAIAPPDESASLAVPTPRPGLTAVVGRVVSSERVPLRDVSVDLKLGGGAALRATATTDVRGRFAIVELPAWGRTAELEFAHPTAGPRRVELTSLSSGSLTDLGDVLLEAGARITGFVADASGAPLPRARVFWDYDNGWMPSVSESARVGAISEADGTFVVADLPAQRVRLCAELDGYASVWSAALLPRSTQPLTDVRLELRASQPLHGRVRDCATGLGADARIGAYRHGIKTCPVQTAADGSFVLHGLIVGERYWITLDSHKRHYPHSCDTPETTDVFTFDATLIAKGLEVTAVHDEQAATLRVIDDADGNPIAGAELVPGSWRSFGTSAALVKIRLPSELAVARSDAAGRFALPDAGGPWQVQAAGYVTADAENAQRNARGEAELRLKRGATLTVTTLWEGGAAPGAEVTLRCCVGRTRARTDASIANPFHPVVARTTTDAQGHAEFAGMAPGTYRVQASTVDGRCWEVVLELMRGQVAQRLDVRLSASAAVAGSITCDGGTAVPHLIALVAVDGHTRGARCSPNGSFALRGLPAGNYAVFAKPLLGSDTLHGAAIALQDRPKFRGEQELALAPGEQRELALPGICGVGNVRGTVTINGVVGARRAVTFERRITNEALDSLIENVVVDTDELGSFQASLLSGAWRANLRIGSEAAPLVSMGGVDVVVAPAEDVRADISVRVGRVLIEARNHSPRTFGASLYRMVGGRKVNTDLLRFPETGSIVIDGVPEGSYRVVVVGSNPAEVGFDVVQGQETRATLEF